MTWIRHCMYFDFLKP